MMFPGTLSGFGNWTLRFGEIPLFAIAGAKPSVPRSLIVLKPRIMVPNGEPPSTIWTWPVSSWTWISSNWISSFGIIITFRSSSGWRAASCGCDNSCACITGNIALLVVSKEKRQLPSNSSPMTYGVLLNTLVVHGTAPRPRALDAGRVRFPPSIRFQTTCSTLKFLAGLFL